MVTHSWYVCVCVLEELVNKQIKEVYRVILLTSMTYILVTSYCTTDKQKVTQNQSNTCAAIFSDGVFGSPHNHVPPGCPPISGADRKVVSEGRGTEHCHCPSLCGLFGMSLIPALVPSPPSLHDRCMGYICNCPGYITALSCKTKPTTK